MSPVVVDTHMVYIHS